MGFRWKEKRRQQMFMLKLPLIIARARLDEHRKQGAQASWLLRENIDSTRIGWKNGKCNQNRLVYSSQRREDVNLPIEDMWASKQRKERRKKWEKRNVMWVVFRHLRLCWSGGDHVDHHRAGGERERVICCFAECSTVAHDWSIKISHSIIISLQRS